MEDGRSVREFAEEQERFAPKYAICSLGRLGLVKKLGTHKFYENQPPNWAWKGVPVFPRTEGELWMSHAASVRFLSQEDCDALDELIGKQIQPDEQAALNAHNRRWNRAL